MLSEELSSFLQEWIAIQLGTRTARLDPNGVRVVAVTVDPDRTQIVAFVPEVSVDHVLPDLGSNGHAAIVFARPPDERACQLKGMFAGARRATDEERPVVEAQWDRWLDRLSTIGLPRQTFANWPVWPCVAITVRVKAIFNQTPGPGAGAALA